MSRPYEASGWALGLPRPTSPVPGVPTQRYSPFVATLPTRQQGSCTPPSGFRAYIPTNSKTTSIFVNLTNPANSLYTDPRVPWAGLTPPPNHSSHHAFHIRSIHTDLLASLTQQAHVSTSLSSHIAESWHPSNCLPKLTRAPTSSLKLQHVPFNTT